MARKWLSLAFCVLTTISSAAISDELLYVVLQADTAQPRLVASDIAATYDLTPNSADGWHIESLGLDSYVFAVPAHLNPDQILERLRRDSRIEIVATVGQYSVAGIADPYFPLQHALVTTRIDESHRISTGKLVKVAIIDTGLDRSHADLRNRVELALNFVDADPMMEIVEFHATAVAGIIGAQGENGVGILGVAPDSRLYSLRACVESNPGSSRGQCSSLALARALDWAVLNKIKIVNMSLQGEQDELVTRLIGRVVEQGGIVVAASELTDGQLAYPASLDEVVAVSDQESNSLAGLAAHSTRIFIAPGEEILTTMPDNTYDFVTGSSFAAAHVTGIIALLVEQAPEINAYKVMSVLRDSVRIVNWGIMVDSCAALNLLNPKLNCRDKS